MSNKDLNKYGKRENSNNNIEDIISTKKKISKYDDVIDELNEKCASIEINNLSKNRTVNDSNKNKNDNLNNNNNIIDGTNLKSEQYISTKENETQLEKVDKKENKYFCKHYVEPKKHCVKIKKHNHTVSFAEENSKIKVSIKPATVVKNEIMDSLEEAQYKIKKLKTMDDFNEYFDILIDELKNLKKKKLKKYDISGDIDDLKYKIKLLIEAKQTIEENNKNLNEKMEENWLQRNHGDKKEKITDLNENKTDSYKHSSSTNLQQNIKKLFEKCEKIKYNSFEIFFLVHDMDLIENTKLDNYIKTITKSFSSIKKWAIGFYTKSFNFKINLIPFENQFKYLYKDFDSNEFKHFKAKNKSEIKNEICNLKWNIKSSKLVINIGKNLKDLNDFIEYNVTSSKVLDKMEINFEFFKISDDKIFDIDLGQILSDISNINYFKELYFLKRNQFKTYDEYKKSKELKFSDEYSIFNKNNDSIEKVNIKKYQNINNSFHFREEIYYIFFENKIVEPSKCLFLTCGVYNFHLHRSIWVEIFKDEESIKRIIDIHLTANDFINEFNQCTSSFRRDIPQIDLSEVGLGQYGKILFFANFVDFDLKYSKIKPDKQTKELNDALAHFSYEFSKGEMILFDIRPLKTDSRILITEPIIFSTIPNNFSSSDLGPKGIQNFKDNHKCNSICKNLKLSKL